MRATTALTLFSAALAAAVSAAAAASRWLNVKSVPKTWKNNEAKAPENAVGKELLVNAQWAKGKDGDWRQVKTHSAPIESLFLACALGAAGGCGAAPGAAYPGPGSSSAPPNVFEMETFTIRLDESDSLMWLHGLTLDHVQRGARPRVAACNPERTIFAGRMEIQRGRTLFIFQALSHRIRLTAGDVTAVAKRFAWDEAVGAFRAADR